MRYAIRLALLASAVALSSAAQEQPKYQSVAPKKKEAKPADPADVATLTGHPVPPSIAARPQPAQNPPAGSNGNEAAPRKGAPLNYDDVDVLTGKYDRKPYTGYRPYGLEGPWAAEWVERRGYGDDDTLFVPGAFGRGSRPLFFRHGRRLSPPVFLLRQFLRGGSSFFLFP